MHKGKYPMQIKTMEQQILEMMEEIDSKEIQMERYKQYFHLSSASNTQLRADIVRLSEENEHLVYRIEELNVERDTLEMDIAYLIKERDEANESLEFHKAELEEAREKLSNASNVE